MKIALYQEKVLLLGFLRIPAWTLDWFVHVYKYINTQTHIYDLVNTSAKLIVKTILLVSSDWIHSHSPNVTLHLPR